MKTSYSLLAAAASAALLLAAAPTRASTVYSQNFETLVSGGLSGQAGFTSTGSAGTPASVTSGGLSYNNGAISVTGGTNQLSVNGAGSNNWAFTNNNFTAQTGTVYFSLCMTWTNLNQNSLLYFALSNVASSASPALGNSGGIAINGFSTANGTYGQIGGRIRGSSSGATTSVGSGINDYPGTSSTQFIVASLSKSGGNNGDYDTFNEWIDPTSATLGTANVSFTQDMGIQSLSLFYFFTGSSDTTSESIGLDNIDIGTTAADVLPLAAIPEPGSWTLLLGGCALLAGTRRRLRIQPETAR